MINTMKDEAETRKNLRKTALEAPKTSGVYLWKDETGQIIYVGKAKSLKHRLSSYFSSNRDIKTRILVSRAHSLEYITCENEYEALLLENTLIKQHSPRYNINLKDGKTYPVIKITNEDFPRVFRTRRVLDDGASYFGPFPNLPAIDGFLDFVKRNYRIRQCRILKKRSVPCLYYHIGRCSAPCAGKIDKEGYRASIDEIAALLAGNDDEGIIRIETMMKDAAKALEFEKAARIRDGMKALESLQEQNAVVDMDGEARDYVAWASEGIMITFAVIRMRSGKCVGRDLYRARSLKDEEEVLQEFLAAYYQDPAQVPPRIFVPTASGLGLAERWLRDALGAQTSIEAIEAPRLETAEEEAAEPTSGWERRHAAAIAMAYFNAKEDAGRRLKEHGDYPALEELKTILSLPGIPSRIEGFDIAHIGGRLPVASLITFRDGNPYRKGYRYFRLRSTDGVIDDFASMREAASRRYTRLLNEEAELPDLILIDGGIGQVNAVRSVLDSLKIDIPIVGLAKRDEELYVPGNPNPLQLPKRSDALRLLQRVRDETHRFATGKNQRLRTKENVTLDYQSLPGVGPKKAAAILKRYGPLEDFVKAVSTDGGRDGLAALLRIGKEAARDISLAAEALAVERKGNVARRAAASEASRGASRDTASDATRGTGATQGPGPTSDGIAELARLAGESGMGDESPETTQ